MSEIVGRGAMDARDHLSALWRRGRLPRPGAM